MATVEAKQAVHIPARKQYPKQTLKAGMKIDAKDLRVKNHPEHFVSVEDAPNEHSIERATSTPGEKRTTTSRKKAAAKK